MALEIDYQQRTVAVVGGTSGINQGIALGFAGLGARVAVASRSQEKVDATVELLEARGASAFGATADVRDFDAVAAFFERAHAALGPLDVLVSGAAGNFPALVKGMSANAFKSVVDIDLNGTFNVLRAAYPYLVKPGASVINISAPQAFVPMQAQAHVCAAKAGVDMMTRCLAMEWGGDGIRVNSIVPGPISGTEGMDRLAPSEAHRAQVNAAVPLGRMGEKQDIANCAAFLGSDLAAYISGVVLPVDGGWSTAGVGGMSDTLAKLARAPLIVAGDRLDRIARHGRPDLPRVLFREGSRQRLRVGSVVRPVAALFLFLFVFLDDGFELERLFLFPGLDARRGFGFASLAILLELLQHAVDPFVHFPCIEFRYRPLRDFDFPDIGIAAGRPLIGKMRDALVVDPFVHGLRLHLECHGCR